MKRLLLILLTCLPSWGACASSWANGYTFCQPLTVASAQITGTLMNPTYDVCFGSAINSNCLSNTGKPWAAAGSGGNLQNGSSFDIIFTSDQAGTTVLKYCRAVAINTTTGVGQIKVKVPSAAVGTVIYMFTGNAAISTDQSDCANAADANTLGCWSFPDGTTLSGALSCGALALTNNGATAAAAQLDGGMTSNYMEQTSTSAFDFEFTQPFTVSYWWKYNSVGTNTDIVDNRHGGTRGWGIFATGPAINDRTFLYLTTSSGVELAIVSSQHFEGGGLTHTVMTYDGSNTPGGVRFYFSGALDTGSYQVVSNNLSGTIKSGLSLWVGKGPVSPISTSILDELVISNVVRSADWIAADFNNQSNNAAFWTLGTQVMNTPAGVQRHH